MSNSDRYIEQADEVLRLAMRADSAAEKEVYLSIAEGWRKLAAEASRHERREGDFRAASEERSFKPS